MSELNFVANTHAEKAVIGAMLMSQNACENGIMELCENDFTENSLRKIFIAIRSLVIKNIKADTVTISHEIGNDLQNIGGTAYISKLIEEVPGASNYPYYSKIIQDYTKLRELQSYFTNGLDSIRTRIGNCTPHGLIDEIERGFDSISLDDKRAVTVGMKSAVAEVEERIAQSIANGAKITGISTGYPILDDLIGGMEGGQMIVLGARPKLGKTSFALGLCLNVSVPVLYISLEMVTRELTMRMLSNLSDISFGILRRPKFLSNEYSARLENAKKELIKKKIEVSDRPGQTIWNVKTLARRAKRIGGLGFMIIDHIQLMGSESVKENRNTELSKISAGFKELAKELDIPILVLSQLSRGNEKENRRPRESDLRDCGSIEQDADIIMFLHRESSEPANIIRTELIIAKQRNGAMGTVMYNFHGKTMRYEELTRHTIAQNKSDYPLLPAGDISEEADKF